MTWTAIGEPILLNLGWQYTPPVEGNLFRLTQSGAAIGNTYFAAQAQINNDGTVLYHDVQYVSTEVLQQTLVFEKPPFFTKRTIAVKQVIFPVGLESDLRRVLNPALFQYATAPFIPVTRSNWKIAVEVSVEPAATVRSLFNSLQSEVDTLRASVTSLASQSSSTNSSILQLLPQVVTSNNQTREVISSLVMGGHSLFSATYTTNLLGSQAVENGLIALNSKFVLFGVQTSVPARVRLYPTAAALRADITRPVGARPVNPNGVIFDGLTTLDALSIGASRDLYGASLEDTPSNSISIAITNQSELASAVCAKFLYASVS